MQRIYSKPDIRMAVVDSVWAACIQLNVADHVASYLQDFLWLILSSSGGLRLLVQEPFVEVVRTIDRAHQAIDPTQKYDLALYAGEVSLCRASILLAPVPYRLPPIDAVLCHLGQHAFGLACKAASGHSEHETDAYVLRSISEGFPKCIECLRIAQQELATLPN